MDAVRVYQEDSGLSYPWLKTDAGRVHSRRSKQVNDCTVRAVATALRIEYDAAYDMLAKAGRKCGQGFRLPKWLETQSWAKKISFPAVRGERRMNPVRFSQEFGKGIYICKVARHVYAVIDGVVHDTIENNPHRCIYTAWRVEN